MTTREALARYFSQHAAGVVAVYLYGSVARGTERPGSDVDVGVLYAVAPDATLAAQPFALEDELSGLLKRRVQVVVLNRAPPDLGHRVLRDGVIVFEQDKGARIAFEVKLRNEYFDLLPWLQQYRRARHA